MRNLISRERLDDSALALIALIRNPATLISSLGVARYCAARFLERDHLLILRDRGGRDACSYCARLKFTARLPAHRARSNPEVNNPLASPRGSPL